MLFPSVFAGKSPSILKALCENLSVCVWVWMLVLGIEFAPERLLIQTESVPSSVTSHTWPLVWTQACIVRVQVNQAIVLFKAPYNSL